MSAALRALALLSAAAMLVAAWQTPQDQPEPLASLRITVTLVQVDAVVTDSSGRHVPDLRAADFELLQDGQPQKITHFSYVPAPPPSALVKPVRNSMPEPLAAPPPIASAGVHRTVALVVDDLALSFENLVRTRQALHTFIEQQMQPGDLVAVIRTGGGVAVLEQFTFDKRILLEAVDSLKWKFFGRTGVLAIHPASGDAAGAGPEHTPQAAPETLDYGYQLAELGTLSTLEQVIDGMKRMPGRKSVVFLSDSLRLDSGILDSLDRITDLANRSAVSLYTVDPGGLRASTSAAAPNTQIYAPDQTTRRFPGANAPGDADSEFSSGAGLEYLATRTGGIFYHNSNDIPGAIRAAADDQLGYYLLAYSPAEGTFGKNRHSAIFHHITLRVHRPGLHVRWKSGFEGVADDVGDADAVAGPPAPKTREAQLAEALASPFAATGIKVRLTCLFLDPRNSGPVVYSMLHFDGHGLTFIQEPDGAWNGSVDVVTLAYRGYNQPLWQSQRIQPIHLTGEVYRRSMKEGFVLNYATPVKAPGAFIIRAVVRDPASEHIGSASQVVDVPDVRKGQFAMSGITLRLATPDILQKFGYSNVAKDGEVEQWNEGGPSLRRFHAGQSVTYGYMVLNPKLHQTPKKAQLSSQTCIYRNGQLFYQSNRGHALDAAPGDLTRYYGGGLLSLGATLTPGEYILQVIVTDELAPKNKNRVSQWMDFEVVDASPSTAAETTGRGGL